MKSFDIRGMFVRRKLESALLTLVAIAGGGMVAARGPLMERTPVAPVERLLSRASAGDAANAGWDLPNLDHELVDTWVARMSGAQKASLAMYLTRMQRHDTMIVRKAAERGMPTDLRFLALVESGGLPTAQSPVKARGLWQFMRGTAKQYGLTVDGRRDERVDPARSTDAALAYLSDLEQRFGSWYLAAAAYNAGEGRVGRVLKEVTGRETGTDADFYRIADRLPKETRNYVPKLIAVARIAKNPARYGLTPADLAAGEVALERETARRAAAAKVAERAKVRAAERAKVRAATKGKARSKAKSGARRVASKSAKARSARKTRG